MTAWDKRGVPEGRPSRAQEFTPGLKAFNKLKVPEGRLNNGCNPSVVPPGLTVCVNGVNPGVNSWATVGRPSVTPNSPSTSRRARTALHVFQAIARDGLRVGSVI